MLNELLTDLDAALVALEEAKGTAEAKAKEATDAQKGYEEASAHVLELQSALRDRIGPLLGASGRVR